MTSFELRITLDLSELFDLDQEGVESLICDQIYREIADQFSEEVTFGTSIDQLDYKIVGHTETSLDLLAVCKLSHNGE